MWRRTALIVAISLLLASRSDVSGQEDESHDLFITQLNWVRFDVIMGRVAAVTNRAKQDRQRARRELDGGGFESLAISIDRGLTSLQFHRECPTHSLTIRVVRRDAVELNWTHKSEHAEASQIVYTQIPGDDVTVSLSSDRDGEHAYRASSLWHLAIGEPDVCASRLLDVLGLLKPDWCLREQADRIRSQLINANALKVATSRSEVLELVRQLGRTDFRSRQFADRELRSRGRSALCLLGELDPTQLDCEQRLRIREIMRFLTDNQSDTTDRVATWLINDKRLWLALMEQDDLETRLAAREHLARILERPVEYDPRESDAVRSRQIAALRTELHSR